MKHPHKGGSYLRQADGTLRPAGAETTPAPATDEAPTPTPADTKPARKAKAEK